MDSTANQPSNQKPNFPNLTTDYIGAGFKAVFQNPAPTPPPPLTPPAPTAAPDSPPTNLPPPSSVVSVTTISPQKPFSQEGKKGGGAKGLLLVGVLVLILGGSVVAFGKIRAFLSNAEGNCTPENIAEANLTVNSVEIVFQTGKACQMEVAYGISNQALLLQVPEAMASLNHRIRLAPLLASTTYYYQVVTEGKKVGTVRSFLTKAPEPVTPTAEPTIVPTPVPEAGAISEIEPTGTATSSSSYTFDDFKSQFGSASAVFDIDKNGMVNMADWLLYRK